MKHIHLTIVVITLTLLSLSVTHQIDATADTMTNVTSSVDSGNSETSQSKIMVFISKPAYVTGETILINGSFNANTLIRVDLVNPLGNTKNSTQIYSDNTGHFHTGLMIPLYGGVNGTWKILTTSGVSHDSLNVMITSNIIVYHPPLVQFKTTHDVEKIICNTNFVKIIKSEDGSPACVKSGTSNILIERGWAKPV